MTAVLLVISFLGLAAQLIGTAIKTSGQKQQAEAQARADTIKAENLEELSAEGGYYDQVLTSLQTELDDVEADREAASTVLATTEAELSGGLAQSKLEEKTTISALQGKVQTSAIQEKVAVATQAVGGLETAQEGARATGQIGARAAVGNVVGGSVLRQAESVIKQVSRRVSLANVGITGTRTAGSIERAGLNAQAGAVRGAAGLERMRMQNDMLKARLSYADTLRGLNTAQYKLAAQQTYTMFQRETGLEQAGELRSEADWLLDYGVPLVVAGGLAEGGVAGAEGAVQIAGQIGALGGGSANTTYSTPEGAGASWEIN